jgi:hypothetical protein
MVPWRNNAPTRRIGMLKIFILLSAEKVRERNDVECVIEGLMTQWVVTGINITALA